MDNKQKWICLLRPTWILGLIVTVGTCAADDSPPASDNSSVTNLSLDDTGYISSTDVADILAAMPDSQAKQLIITASSLPREETPEAERLYRRALGLMANEVDEQYQWGPLCLLAKRLRSQNRAREATPLIRAAYENARKYHSPNSTAVLHTINDLAWDSVKTDRATAVKLALQAEQLIERTAAERHPLELMLDRLMVGSLLFAVAEMERSERLLLLVLKDPGLVRLNPYNRARLLHQLGMISDDHQKTAQAISYLNQSLVFWTALSDTTPGMHYEMGQTYYLLGSLLVKLGEPARAEQQLRLAVEQFEIGGPQSEDHTFALRLLGKTLLELNHPKQARDVLVHAYEIQKKSGEGMCYVLWLYGRALEQLADYSGAASTFHDAQLRCQEEPEHPFDVAFNAYERGRMLRLAEQFCAARAAFDEAGELLQQIPIEQRPPKAATLKAEIAKAQNSDTKRICTQ